MVGSLPEMNRVILFDFDGVVADSLEVFLGVFTGICGEMGFDRLNSREAFLDLFERNPIRRLFWAGFPLWRLKELGRQFQPRIEEASRRIRPFEKMPDVLRELARRDPVYIITSNVTATGAPWSLIPTVALAPLSNAVAPASRSG